MSRQTEDEDHLLKAATARKRLLTSDKIRRHLQNQVIIIESLSDDEM